MIGTTLSHYQVLEKLGAGGMGVVYRARDTKLGRDVAIKVLPADVSHDAERLSRFEREARLLASLNHPHVATLHGFEEDSGTRFLVMELVEGETLADRIARGPILIDEALPFFRQMAEGLEAAHDKGIIHRDLKPGNVKITPAGNVKVLDFGLAKVFSAAPASGPQSESPTVTRSPSEAGVILGTAAYMSPEQARGKTLDKRTDVWSFGCCLFEALTGRAPFLGETVSDTLAKILETEPSWKALPGQTPSRIRELLARCLTKDPGMRLHDIADARVEIVKASEEPAELPAAVATRVNRATLAAIGVAGVFAAVALWSLTRSPVTTGRAVTRSILPLPEGERLARDVAAPSVAISPDGRYIAFLTGVSSVTGSERSLSLRSLDEMEARAIEGSNGADNPVFSPDSQWVGFARDRTLLRTAVSGGAPRRISSLGGTPRGVDWRGDELVFSGEVSSGLFRVPAAGGEPEVLTVLHKERREKAHRFPQVLPGGDAVLFTLATSTTESWDDASIAVGSMKTGEYKIVLEGGANARYSPTGHLVFAWRGALHAVTFDLENLEVTGQPVRVLEDVMTSPVGGAAEFALAENGSLVYAPGLSRTDDRRVVWVDRDGRVEPLIETPRLFTALR
ncbi:MAG TPA: protein kinase, partial [Vicinamibacteria bacterium]|nr:protein kinase [Vicinamibacteria bacterium]